MAQKSTTGGPTASGPTDVDKLLAELDHPLLAELQALRTIFLAADERISEGVKWNAPSFFYIDWFATFNLRSTKEIQVILHTGAKVKASSIDGVPIDDPEGLLKWLAKDRCLVTLSGMSEIEVKKEAVTAIIQQWVNQM
jgi:hypothetical protein